MRWRENKAAEQTMVQHYQAMHRLNDEIVAAKRELRKWERIRQTHSRRGQDVPVSRFLSRWRGARLVLVLALAGLVATAGGVALVLNPFDVLRTHGPVAAKRVLGEGEPRTLEARYQHSWLAYLDGEHERAARGAYAILAEDEITPHMRGNCFYLLGLIHTKAGKYQVALGHYEGALESYRAIQAHANLYYVAVETANANAALTRYDAADRWLAEAWQHYQADRSHDRKIVDLGQYYLVRGDLAAARGDYLAALEAARASLTEAEQSGDRAMLPYALVLVGFWYDVNGCRELGTHFTEMASVSAAAIGDERALVFCLVNNILQAPDDHQTVAYIRTWADLKNDAKLIQSLDLALTITIEEHSDICETFVDPQRQEN